jgi:phosphoribosylformylglycinamidine cyclo-ligase
LAKRVYTDQEHAEEIMNIASGFNLAAAIIGRCEASEKKQLTIKSEFGTFEYI